MFDSPNPRHAPLQAVFLRAVKLYNSGDFRSSAEDMERALAEYLAVFARCLAGCEGAHEQVDFKDFYPAIAGTLAQTQGASFPATNGPCSEQLRPLSTFMEHLQRALEVVKSQCHPPPLRAWSMTMEQIPSHWVWKDRVTGVQGAGHRWREAMTSQEASREVEFTNFPGRGQRR